MDSWPIEEDDIQSESMSLDDINHCRLELTESPKAEAGIWDGITRLELMYSKLSELPLSPNFPLLRVLLLQGNADLMEIPPLFFDRMPLLQTLDLSYTSITDLPTSFFGLVELTALYLRGCELFMELPPEIGQLKKLEELDLNGTQITHVPTEIQELINLQHLSLYFCEYGENISQVIPKGLISKLTRLSYLSIDVNPDHSKWDETVRIILQEISELRFLRTLILYVPRAELLKHIPEKKDLDFRLVAGHHTQRIIARVPPLVEEKFKQNDRSLRFVYGNDVVIPQEISILLRRTKSFFLDRHMTIKHLSELGLVTLHHLQVCIVAECNEMQTIVEGGHSYINSLRCLKVLSVFYMKKLRGIWEGGPPSDLFLVQLKSLTLSTCPNLTTVFTLNFIQNLVNLEELLVQDCPKVTTLVTRNALAFSVKSFLPRIRKISLLYLPELVSISSGLKIGPNLEKIGFYYCRKLQHISSKELCSKRLKVIKGETKWWEVLRWKDAMRGQNLNDIFSPIDEEVDIMTQLLADVDESSSFKNIEILPPFAMTHQQAIAPVTAQAVQAQANMLKQAEHSSSISATSLPQAPSFISNTSSTLRPSMPASGARVEESPDYSHSEDGYNWRKYGQKLVTDSEFHWYYYRCTHPNCPVKKKVERSLDGHESAVIYKGRHNHQPPLSNKRTKDNVASNKNLTWGVYLEGLNRLKDETSFHSVAKMELEPCPALSGSDGEEVGDHDETELEEKNDEPDHKRRNMQDGVPEPVSSNRTVIEPRIVVRTTSEVDNFDDGYRWRKYGQKDIIGSPYPRGYYRCATLGCKVQKRVQRDSTDPKAVITTYEGKHNHDEETQPIKQNSNIASLVTRKHSSSSRDLGSNDDTECIRYSEPTRGLRGPCLTPLSKEFRGINKSPKVVVIYSVKEADFKNFVKRVTGSSSYLSNRDIASSIEKARSPQAQEKKQQHQSVDMGTVV